MTRQHELPNREAQPSEGRPIFLFCLLLALYGAVFILRTSFVIGGKRYFCLFDDMMISMRYARNLAEGSGLVWNPGEYVEGYTNLGWVLYMAFLHLVFPLSDRLQPLLVQVSNLVLLCLVVVVTAKLAERISDGNAQVRFWSVLFASFYYPLVNWSLQGTEVAILTVLLATAVWTAFRAMDQGRGLFWPYVLLWLGSIVRMDFLVPAAVFSTLLGCIDGPRRWRHVVYGSGAVLLSLLPQTAFRYFYYGELLPNTYYLKVSGVPLSLRVARGLWSLWRLASGVNLLVFSLPFLFLFVKRDRRVGLCLGMFCGLLLYNVLVGGDAWEHWGGSNRFVAPAMPLFFAVFCGGFFSVLSCVGGEWGAAARSLRVPLLVAAFVWVNLVGQPARWKQWLLVAPPPEVESNARMVRLALTVREVTDPRATVAVVWAGSIPYFSRRLAVDLLGKNDPVVARGPVRLEGLSALSGCPCRAPETPAKGWRAFRAYVPGHAKWNLDHSLGVRKPDLLAQFWWKLPERFAGIYRKASADEFELWVRRDSEHVFFGREHKRYARLD